MACPNCLSSRARGHNYCTSCRERLNPGMTNFARVAEASSTSDRFCGTCGQLKHAGPCHAAQPAEVPDPDDEMRPAEPQLKGFLRKLWDNITFGFRYFWP
jgi:hypothetical protein